METSQDKILNYCLKNCVFDGWTHSLLEKASIEAGLDKNYWKILFPRGMADVLDYYETKIDEKLSKNLTNHNFSNLRTHQKIRELIILRFGILAENKPAINSIVQASLSAPAYSAKKLYSVSDKIWRLAGDTATDWNFYSKRALLSGVYTSTLMFWLNDTSENHAESWVFLDRRLADVAKFGKMTSKLKAFGKKFAPVNSATT